MADTASYSTAPDHDHLGAFLIALADLEEFRRSGPTGDSRGVRLRACLRPGPINLSVQIGIDTGPERFVVPERERERLQKALVEALPVLQEVLFPPES